jgi:YYY domain-containing protein
MADVISSAGRPRRLSLGISRSDVLVGILLVCVLLVGGYLRFTGLNWDDYTHMHPDERFLTSVASMMGQTFDPSGPDPTAQLQRCMERYPATNGIGGFFDAECSTMNPHNNNRYQSMYVYGTLPTFLVRWSADALIRYTNDPVWGTYNGIHLVGRALSALAETAVILIVFFIGVELHDKWVGLLAALLYATVAFSIQQAHFWTVDAMSNLFVVLAVWAAVRVQTTGRLGAYLEFGIFFGAALASRINTLPVVGLLLLAVGVRALPALFSPMPAGERQRIITWSFAGLILAGLATFITFRIGNPYAFMGPGFFGLKPNPRWLQDVSQAQYLVSGNAESPPNWQWAGRTRYLFPFSNMVLWGMGLGLGLAGWAAWAWSGWRLLRGKAGALRNIIPFAWIAVYFGWLGNLWVMTMRYYLPMYPLFALLAAWGLLELARRANRSGAGWRRLLAGAALVGVTGFTILWGLMYSNIYRHLLTNVQASHWINENLPGDFSMRLDGTDAPLINISFYNRPSDLAVSQDTSVYDQGGEAIGNFFATVSGTIRTIDVSDLKDPLNDAGDEAVRMTVRDSQTDALLASGTLKANLSAQPTATGTPRDIPLETPLRITQGQTYSLKFEVLADGPVNTSGSFTLPVEQNGTQLGDLSVQIINRTSVYDQGAEAVGTFVATVSGTVTHVRADNLSDPLSDFGQESIRVSILDGQTNQTLTSGTLTVDLSDATGITNTARMIQLDKPVQVTQGESYTLGIEVLSGGPVTGSGNFMLPVEQGGAPVSQISAAVVNRYSDDNTPIELTASRYEPGQAYTQQFTPSDSGTISHVTSPHLGDLYNLPGEDAVDITVTDPYSNNVLGRAVLRANLTRDQHILGNAYDIAFDRPITVNKGQNYNFTVRVTAEGPVISAGPVFTWEGDWDEVSPPKVCQLPPGVTLKDDPPPGLSDVQHCQGIDLWSAQINGYKLQVYYEDDAAKRALMQRILNNTDYLIIGSNRRYDSQSRIPYRWPMTMRYYDALFSGKLGFEQSALFQETFQLGPLKVSDQYLPTYNAPQWLNEFEAEEAFHVYDHPAVFIYHKTDAYSPENTRQILDSVPLNKADLVTGSFNDPMMVGVMQLYSLPASAAPTGLQLTPAMRLVQFSGGTWSERFSFTSLINSQPIVTVVIWWLTIVVFGWAAWPLLFAILPGLSDRGYGLAKMSGLVITGWLAWFVSSAQIPMWSGRGILIALLALAALSAWLAWRNRAAMRDYLRANRARLAWIEVITLMAFIGFLGVRLTNPDLWHPWLGGEKPMDFAYFNGVLRSTTFPPIDPWYAGGYINYYYFGYVIVGAPTLLLGVVPSVAYNLILPTLFALTGIGAFSIAFNLVSALNNREPSQPASDAFGRLRRLGNPWVAGVAALLLAVVLGNLDTPRLFVGEGLAKTGYYQRPAELQTYLTQQYQLEHNGAMPDADALAQITRQSADEANSLPRSILRGIERLQKGAAMDVAPNRWYWAPTRILQEMPTDGETDRAIAEMPYFTFLYGDLHAHMIAMPMHFLVLGFVLSQLLIAGRDERRRLEQVLAVAFGGLIVGLLRATNTWDWITYMLLSVLGLGFAWWLGARGVGRKSLLALAGTVGGFLLFSFALSLPYITWYASVYNKALPWNGPRTPLWAYLDIHGLFIFLVFSLLVWETGRWLRSVRVSSLRGKGPALAGGCLAIIFILLGAALLAFTNHQVTLVVVPLLLWIGILFFRQGQSREMQFVLVLAGLALGLTLGVEFIVLDGDIGRQNTLFKFYIQAWLLFSVVGGAAVAWLLNGAERWSGWARNPWYLVTVVLFTSAALYPIMATRGRAQDRMSPDTPLTLDGMTYMLTSKQYEGDPTVLAENPTATPIVLADDYNMIRWMLEHVQGSPVIMEGRSTQGSEYKWDSRVAIYTGLPSVLGWNFHQRQQRTLDPMPRVVQQREANINAFYTTTNIDLAWDMLRHYDVTYIIVGGYEKAYYPAAGLAKFDEMVGRGLLKVVYQGGSNTIYETQKDALFGMEEGL